MWFELANLTFAYNSSINCHLMFYNFLNSSSFAFIFVWCAIVKNNVKSSLLCSLCPKKFKRKGVKQQKFFIVLFCANTKRFCCQKLWHMDCDKLVFTQFKSSRAPNCFALPPRAYRSSAFEGSRSSVLIVYEKFKNDPLP